MADGADRKDADLVADVRAGNTASFALLFDRWFGPVLGAAQDLVGVQAEAARVATDTFQSVWLHLDELADPEGFGAWVLLTSRTFARQRQAERDPSAGAPSGPLFENEDELRRAVAKILVRRQVPALGQPVPAPPSAPALAPAPAPGAAAPGSPGGAAVAGTLTEVPEVATDRLHRYHWAPAEPALSVTERIRSFRLSPGTLVALAIVLVGSFIWLMGRDDSSEIQGGRPAPLFSPASPTTIDGAAARSDNGAPDAAGIAPSSLPPEPVTPAPTEAAAPASSRKVKVAAVVPRSVGTTPARRGATVSAPGSVTPVATVTTAPPPPGAPRTDQPSTTATVPPSSASTTASTARTTTTAGPTTASTARTTTTTTTVEPTTASTGRTTTTGGRTTTTADVTTTTARASTTTTRAVTSTTARPSTTTTAPATTRVSASATTAPPAISPLTD